MAPRATVLTLLLAATLGLAAPAAQAGCGGTVKADPGKTLGDFDNPLVIGDSVLLGAVKPVARLGFEVNTRGCRSWSEGAKIVRRRRSHGHLPHLVVMFLGADWEVSTAQIRETLYRIGPKRVLALVTPREVGGAGGPDAQHMRDMAAENPHRVLLLDWVRHTRGKSSWFAPDGIHLGYPGIAGLARFLKTALPFAAPGEFPAPAPAETPPPPDPAPAG